MIKLPEPVAYSYKLSTAVENGIYARFDRLRLELTPPAVHPDAFRELTKLYTEAQLKQAVRDALNLAVDTCESTLYVEGDGTVSVYGPKTDANTEIRKCRDAIRALIKEIPE